MDQQQISQQDAPDHNPKLVEAVRENHEITILLQFYEVPQVEKDLIFLKQNYPVMFEQFFELMLEVRGRH